MVSMRLRLWLKGSSQKPYNDVQRREKRIVGQTVSLFRAGLSDRFLPPQGF
jgi:hypothetical protein